MTEQELHDARRAELLAGIMGALSGPGVPIPPKEPGPDSSSAEREAFARAAKDHAVHVTLAKSTGDISQDERNELLSQVRDCLRKGW